LTSNNSRELSEAVKRRCLHLYIPFPKPGIEREIVGIRVPGISEILRAQLVSFIQQVRQMDLKKSPSISETIDWAKVLVLLHANALSADLVHETLNVFLKFEEDIRTVEENVRMTTEKAIKEAAG
jgi:MoxR-like ATPase